MADPKKSADFRYWEFVIAIIRTKLMNCNVRWWENTSSKKHPQSSAVHSYVYCCSIPWLHDFLAVKIEFYCTRNIFCLCVCHETDWISTSMIRISFVVFWLLFLFLFWNKYSIISIWGVTVLLVFLFLSKLLPHTIRFSTFQPFCTQVN